MITKTNLQKVLKKLGFSQSDSNALFLKHFEQHNCDIQVDCSKEIIIYPTEIDTGANTTTNFSQNENFVVLECVCRLLEKGYDPKTLFLEKSWQLGHTGKSGRADITVYDKDTVGNPNQAYLIIECKCSGKEFKNARKDMFENAEGKQLFSYWAQARSAKWLQLYASDYDEEQDEITFQEEVIRSYDDENVEALAKEDTSILIFKNASTAQDAFLVWETTYSKKVYGNTIIFGSDAVAYKIGNPPLVNRKLKKFTKDTKITDDFREILRHNSISDKENAFNKLLSLFICKFVDEALHNAPDDIMAFQYVDGSDNYYKLYERLLGLFQIGMRDFLKEDVFYLENDYIRKTLDQFTGKRRKELEKELVDTFQKTKMLSCQVFAFREVYNEKLFLQNGKILVEVVELFQQYRMSYTSKEQLLGDLFENLLNQGFKQEAGQFFTPIPITRFVWNALPFERFLDKDKMKVPRVVDFACGSGHFLTEGIAAISDYYNKNQTSQIITDKEISKTFFGVDKDNRLARVSKVALLLNGADEAHIIAADGLEQDEYFYQGDLHSFDILVANPPYSVDAFKTHESRTIKSTYETIKLMSLNCKDIQNVFIERMEHLLKPKGIAGIVMPSTVLSNTATHDIKTREIILRNFHINAIVSFAGKTFGETGTNTVILFLEHFDFPPKKFKMAQDSVTAILNNEPLQDWNDNDIFSTYLATIHVQTEDYRRFVAQEYHLFEQNFVPYFAEYKEAFIAQRSTKISLEKIDQAKEKNKDGSPLRRNEKSAEELQEALENEFYIWVKHIEEQKLLYFALTYTGRTLLITAPSDTDEQKRFLGYEFSTRRGKEGIIEAEGYLTNMHDRNDRNKLAWFVKAAFDGIQCESEPYRKYVSYIRTADLLDFSRPSLDLQLKLTADKTIEISSKYPLVKLGKIAEVSSGNSAPQGKHLYSNGKYPFFRTSDVGNVHLSKNLIEVADYLNDNGIKKLKKYPKGTILMPKSGASTYLNHRAIMGVDGYVVSHLATIIADHEKVLTDFLYEILVLVKLQDIKVNSDYPSLNINDIENIKIPLPPLDVQQQIVAECEKVDEEYNTSRMTIEEYKKKIAQVFERLDVITNVGGGVTFRLSNTAIFDISIGRRVLNSEVSPQYTIPVYSANVFEPFGMIDKLLIEDFSNPSILWGIDGDWMVNTMDAGIPFYPTDHCGVLRIKTDDILPKYMAYLLEKEGKKAGFSRSYRASIDRIKSLSVQAAPIEEQRKALKEIEAYESEIAVAKAVLSACAEKKKMILDKWL